MLSILWDPPSASSVPFNTEPTAYELDCQRSCECETDVLNETMQAWKSRP